jgi:type I restriction enzyme S subunit
MNLGDLFTVAKGKKPPGVLDTSGHDTVRLLQIEDLRAGAVARYCYHTDSQVLCEQSDIVIAWDGAHAGIVGSGLQGVCGSTLARLRPATARTHTPFVVRYLESQLGNIRRNRTGATIPHVNGTHLRAIDIPLPPLPEQKRIAAILDAADAFRAKRRESIEQLDSLIQATFLKMFGDPSSKPTVIVKPMTDVVKRFIDYRGKSPSKASSGVPLITAKIVKDKSVAEPNEFIPNADYSAWMRRGIPEPGDVILTTEAPMGEVALVPDYKAAFAQRLLVLQPHKSEVTPAYLMWALTMPFIREQLRKRSTGSTVTGIRSKEFKQVLVPVPTLHMQAQFSAVVESVTQQKARLKAHLAELDTLFASLQSRAFNGELVA